MRNRKYKSEIIPSLKPGEWKEVDRFVTYQAAANAKIYPTALLLMTRITRDPQTMQYVLEVSLP